MHVIDPHKLINPCYWHLPLFLTHLGAVQTQPVDDGLSPYEHLVVGVAVEEGKGVVVGEGLGVGVGVEVGVGVGVGTGVVAATSPVLSHTARSGLTNKSLSTSVTAGSLNVGTVVPPTIIATVPVGET
jgi:hypothetical protein